MDPCRVHVWFREIEPATWRRIEISFQTTLKESALRNSRTGERRAGCLARMRIRSGSRAAFYQGRPWGDFSESSNGTTAQ